MRKKLRDSRSRGATSLGGKPLTQWEWFGVEPGDWDARLEPRKSSDGELRKWITTGVTVENVGIYIKNNPPSLRLQLRRRPPLPNHPTQQISCGKRSFNECRKLAHEWNIEFVAKYIDKLQHGRKDWTLNKVIDWYQHEIKRDDEAGIKHLKDIDGRKSAYKFWRDRFGNLPVSELTHEMQRDFMVERLQFWTRSTYNSYASYISSAIKLAVDRGYCKPAGSAIHKCAEGVSRNNRVYTSKKNFTDDEIARLIRQAIIEKHWLLPYLMLRLHTGGRCVAISHLKYEQFRWNDGQYNQDYIRLQDPDSQAKENKIHSQVLMTPTIRKVIKSLPVGKPRDFVIPNSKGKPIQSFSDPFQRLANRAGMGNTRRTANGVSHGNWHIPGVMRSHVNNMLLQEDVPDNRITLWMGWTSQQMGLRHYTNGTDVKLLATPRDAVEAHWQHLVRHIQIIDAEEGNQTVIPW